MYQQYLPLSRMVALNLALYYSVVRGAPATAQGTSPPAIMSGDLYNVAGVGLFTDAMNISFTGSFPSDQLVKSDYTVHDTADNPDAKFNHHFDPSLVTVSDGFLNLEVPGGQKPKRAVKCAEVSTNVDDIFYASVRTLAIFSSVPGTVHGNFFYYNDSQEIDIEYLTDPNSESNPNGRQPLMLTNQAVNGNPADETHADVPSPADRTTALHEYRTDWLEGRTVFYLDGQRVKTFRTNVPTIPGPWIWNNWCNGDPGFTVGPPAQNNIFKLQNIVMYYNTSNS